MLVQYYIAGYYFVTRRVTSLREEQSELIVPYAVATGDIDNLVQHFTSLGQLQVVQFNLIFINL